MDMNDPNVAAIIQQQMMWNAAGGMGMTGYDPSQQFAGFPYGATGKNKNPGLISI